MKSKSLFIAALVVFCAVISALGKEEPTKVGLAVINIKGTEIFKVIYKGESAGKVKLRVISNDGKTILTETLNSDSGFILPLNFKGIQYGEYTVELVDADGKRVEKVNHVKKTTAIKNIHIARVANEKSKYILAVSSVGAEMITVDIYDAQNNLVHTETKDITGNFAQIYSLKNIPSGCSFVVTDKTGNSHTVKF